MAGQTELRTCFCFIQKGTHVFGSAVLVYIVAATALQHIAGFERPTRERSDGMKTVVGSGCGSVVNGNRVIVGQTRGIVQIRRSGEDIATGHGGGTASGINQGIHCGDAIMAGEAHQR